MAAVLCMKDICKKTRVLGSQVQVLKIGSMLLTKNLSGKGEKSTEKTSTGKEDKIPKGGSYQASDYYSHNEDTFADLEIEMASFRLPQPDPRVPYYHHYPWESK